MLWDIRLYIPQYISVTESENKSRPPLQMSNFLLEIYLPVFQIHTRRNIASILIKIFIVVKWQSKKEKILKVAIKKGEKLLY